MHKPWEEWGMTETEYRQYQDEYADWLDSLNNYCQAVEEVL